MLEMDVLDAQQRLPDLIDAARNGDEVYVTQLGRRVAKIVPISPTPRRHAGGVQGMIVMAGDFGETPGGRAGNRK